MSYDYDRPYTPVFEMKTYKSKIPEVSKRFGSEVKAFELSNKEYKFRFQKLCGKQKMKAPPGNGRIFSGWLVVRNLGKKNQYETWMPCPVFDEIYGIEDPRSLEIKRKLNLL